MIPQEKSRAVTRALREAFDAGASEDIRMLTKGQTSALVFRIVVHGAPYLLRMIMRADDPARHFACMRAAAVAGLAPRVWYTSIEDKLSITDFVETVPFSQSDALVRIPQTLRNLHALPPFPTALNNINTTCTFLLGNGPAIDAFIKRIKSANILTTSEGDKLFAQYEQLTAVHQHHNPDPVSSHNDLFKPDNILYDGHRVWLVDWEAAFFNDRYADLAVVANLLVTSDADENAFLREYFGKSPDDYQRARFFLMQQLSHMFYGLAYLLLNSAGNATDQIKNAPHFNDFQRQFWTGEIVLETPPVKIAFGRFHLDQFFRNVQQARFADSLKIVADRH